LRVEGPADLDPALITDDHGIKLVEPDLPVLTEPVVHVDRMRIYARSLAIAALFRKRHNNVLAAVREIVSLQPELNLPNLYGR
jgi:hypothetical protein